MIAGRKEVARFLIGYFKHGPCTTLSGFTDYKMPPPLADDQIGFASVSLTTGVFTQLPNIPCHEIWIGNNSGNIKIGGSANPGLNVVEFDTAQSSTLAWAMIPTGGNANNLFINPATTATLGFLWRNPRTQLVGWAA